MSKRGESSNSKPEHQTPSPRRLKKLTKALSNLPHVPDRVVLNFSIAKEANESWGIRIVGGTESISSNIYVKGILPRSVCGLDGNLQVGDQLLEVNGERLVGIPHEDAVDVFRRCQTQLNVVVSRMVENKLQKDNCSLLSSYESSILSRYQSNAIDEEPVVLEHKPLPLPNNYSTTIW